MEQEGYKDTVFLDQIIKRRDDNGNNIISGSDGNEYYLESKNCTLSKGSLCRVKLCKNLKDESDYAIKRFNKLTLRKQK